MAAHVPDGLAFAAVAAGALVGWRRLSPVWLAPVAALLAVYASGIFAHATDTGKVSGALSNVFFELLIFALWSLAGFFAGRLMRRRGPLST